MLQVLRRLLAYEVVHEMVEGAAEEGSPAGPRPLLHFGLCKVRPLQRLIHWKGSNV